MAWSQTVKNDPLPVHYRLVEIADLFTKGNFEDDPSIEIKQAKLKNAIVYYCQDILRLSLCNSTGPESEARIRIVMKNNVKYFPKSYMGNSKSIQQKFGRDRLRIGRNLVCK